MTLISECVGWDVETEALSHWQSHRDLFPSIPSQSRYNRRRRALNEVLKVMRHSLIQHLDVAADCQCAIDSLPIGVCAFHHAPRASSEWRSHEAQLGYVSAKKQWVFGYRLQSLITLRGVIVDFMLAPAGYKDSEVVDEFLHLHPGRRILADKGYVHRELAQCLAHEHGVYLIARTRKNQKRHPLPAALQACIPKWREICETVHSQLVEQFRIQRNHARSFAGLCTRLVAKLTAHTFCIYLNRLFGNPDFLPMKSLAFPN
ncbi:MAG: IS982 family transposase [Anaerolineae bacterium]|nr:IS982 family transposase [Anaerolineae bacterium]